MMRCLFALLVAALACAQPTFDVASVKPYDPASAARYTLRGGPGTDDPGRFSCQNCSLRSLIVAAYDIQLFQLTSPSAPDRYDVEAKVPEGATKEQFRAMLQNLLAERFHLQLHHQPQEMTVYTLVLGKGRLEANAVPIRRSASRFHNQHCLANDVLPHGRNQRADDEARKHAVDASGAARTRCNRTPRRL